MEQRARLQWGRPSSGFPFPSPASAGRDLSADFPRGDWLAPSRLTCLEQKNPWGLAKPPGAEKLAVLSPNSQSLLQDKHLTLCQRGPRGPFFFFALETPCVRYFKQAPAHEALLTRLKTDGASGCSVAPETNMGSAKPSRVQATLGFFLKDKSGQASHSWAARACFLHQVCQPGEGSISFHCLCPRLHLLNPLAAREKGGLC